MQQKKMLAYTMVLAWFACAAHGASAIPELRDTPHRWRPIKDEVFLQEVSERIATEAPVTAAAVHDGAAYFGAGDGVIQLEGAVLKRDGLQGEAVKRLRSLDGVLLAITDSGLFVRGDDGWTRIAEGAFSDACLHKGGIWVAGPGKVHRLENRKVVETPYRYRGPRPILRIASYSDTLYALGPGGMALLDLAVEEGWDSINVWDWGSLPSLDTRDLLAFGNRMYIGTQRGLGVLRGMALTRLRGEDGLCCEDVTCLAEGFDGDVWVGTTEGAIRMVDGEFHYFAADRWLPDNRVNAIAADDRIVYIATDGGVGIIRYEPYTLRKKAAFYERRLEEWGQKRLGFTHKLEWNEEKGGWVREISDNDAGWSTHYLGAQCFKYAVTGDDEARREAENTFLTLKWCEEISSIPGYPARSVWAVGERGNRAEHGSGGLPAEWIPTPDGTWLWKSDTSSDEIDAHFYAVPIFHDLAADDRYKALAKEHLARIADHIIDNGWVLRDLDGKPTVWGRWDRDYFNSERGNYARGLNGMEALTFMRTAYAVTGEARFKAAYEQALEWGYHRHLLRQKLVFPPDFIFHSDDRLAFYCYFPLLAYATDPDLQSLYFRSLERSWEVERIERIPWFNFIYGVLTGNQCEAEEAAAHLRQWPLDLIKYRYRNSNRTDLHPPEGYVPYSGGTRPLTPRSRGPLRWSSNMMGLDGGSGREVVDPSGWIETYWMGRYFGLITPPETDDPELVDVPERNVNPGAAPYDGPPRPEYGTPAFQGRKE